MDVFISLSEQALPLFGYMAWPNDPIARARWLDAHRPLARQSVAHALGRFKIKHLHWARIADIVHLHYDLTRGQHQERRGGPSVGKAISLVDSLAKSKGTGTAKLWEIWKTYKDVAHLVTAAVLVAGEAQTRHRQAPSGLGLQELMPYRMAMRLPDLVIAVAMTIESYGLRSVAHGRREPMFDPETLWRIPPDINLDPVDFPARPLGPAAIAVLNARRAGNRGKGEPPPETTPVFA